MRHDLALHGCVHIEVVSLAFLIPVTIVSDMRLMMVTHIVLFGPGSPGSVWVYVNSRNAALFVFFMHKIASG